MEIKMESLQKRHKIWPKLKNQIIGKQIFCHQKKENIGVLFLTLVMIKKLIAGLTLGHLVYGKEC